MMYYNIQIYILIYRSKVCVYMLKHERRKQIYLLKFFTLINKFFSTIF